MAVVRRNGILFYDEVGHKKHSIMSRKMSVMLPIVEPWKARL